ncbi:MAG: hypothetical protein K2M46_03890 [Lachnospiraceae bacterium]|nr:hypothetical protein [Lachnospiraceae bacterium]
MKKLTKIITRILLIVCVIFLYEKGIQFLYQNYKDNVIYTNKDRKKVEGNIETLVLGTSTAQRGFEPLILNEELDTVSFNLASSLQPLEGTYALLVDANKTNPIKRVFLGVTPSVMGREKMNTVAKSLVYDRLFSKRSKFAYLTYGCELEEVPYITLYSVRVEDYLDFSLAKKNVSMKLTEEFRAGETHKRIYKGNGRITLNKSFQPKAELKQPKKKFEINQEQELYLEKIIHYCKECQIELILTFVPQTKTELYSYQNVAEIKKYFQELSQAQQVQYWDFNYYESLKKLFPDAFFEDEKHLNKEGGDIFTKEFSIIYKNYHAGENVDELFLETCPYFDEE